MRCPICDLTEMTTIGCCTYSNLPILWCPNCGAIKSCSEEPIGPALAMQHYPPASKPIIVKATP